MGELTLSSDMTIHQALATIVSSHPDREALVVGETRVTYPQLGQRVNALAAGLRGLGLNKGDKVAVILDNCPEFAYSFFAIGQAGGVVVPLNPLYRRRELQYMLDDAEVSFVIFTPEVRGNDLLGMLQDMREELPHLRHLIIQAAPAPESMISLESLMTSTGPEPPADLVAPDDLFGLMYTSGTTGEPKAVMHTHRTMLAPSLAGLEQMDAMMNRPLVSTVVSLTKTLTRYGTRFVRWAKKQQTNIITSPFHHMAGYGSLLPGILGGRRLVVMERFHPSQVLELVEREQINILVGTPSMYTLMLKARDFDQYDKSSLLYCVISTAPCPPELAREVRKRFDSPVMIAFGATETGGGVTMTSIEDSDAQQTETVGRVFPGAKVKIVDDERRELPLGQVGELATHLRGVMQGYYKAPEATAEALDDEGWYYTGDLAVMDEEGYVRIVGRKKDMIIRGGQNVYPAEVERYLLTHPAIQAVAVVGVPSEVEGETVWAYVVPEEGATLATQEVLEYCQGEIVAYKIPSQVRIVDALPRTAVGKVQKFKLHEMALQELGRP
jgi:fatty-acyl-CoA synthase